MRSQSAQVTVVQGLNSHLPVDGYCTLSISPGSVAHVCPRSWLFVPKRILVVCHDRPLKMSRVELLRRQGYDVESVEADDEAMALLLEKPFDLILLGRKSALREVGLDRRIRETYPDLLTLKIMSPEEASTIYPSRMVDSEPRHVIEALRDMLGHSLQLVPLRIVSNPSQPPTSH
jgi:CheY-like chemotaxis protein